jgi:hypothetical protein
VEEYTAIYLAYIDTTFFHQSKGGDPRLNVEWYAEVFGKAVDCSQWHNS